MPHRVLPFISNPDYDLVHSIYPFTMRDLDGQPVNLGKYAGHVCIIVNVASRTVGFTDHNYKVLSNLHQKYAESRGLRILAFPCNQFNNEEPDSNKEIKMFVQDMDIMFDVFSKISVNCHHAHPLWKYMKTAVGGTGKLKVITDPFTKFIVSRTGVPLARIGPGASEDDIYEVLEPLFVVENQLTAKKSVIRIDLPPPPEEEDRPCMQPWHFKPGISKLI